MTPARRLSMGVNPGVWLILPTRSLRDLALRHADRLLPGCNYRMLYYDTRGYGLQLATVDWLPPGQTHTQW